MVLSSSGYDNGGVCHQFCAFKDIRYFMKRDYIWLSSVAFNGYFCMCYAYGLAMHCNADNTGGTSVRPRFIIQ